MDQLLGSLPKTVIAIGAMVLFLFLYRQFDPPRTVCGAQMDLFRDSQKKFLYSEKKEGQIIKKPSRVKLLYDLCKNDNSPGGCFELFVNMKKVTVDLDNVPEHCAEAAGEEPELREWLWKSLKLMAQMAWGERAPASYMVKNGWFDTSDVALFCSLRRHAIRMYGREMFTQWQEQLMTGMPEANKLTRDQLWQRNLVSTPCDMYR